VNGAIKFQLRQIGTGGTIIGPARILVHPTLIGPRVEHLENTDRRNSIIICTYYNWRRMRRTDIACRFWWMKAHSPMEARR
jgi:hypothetical protein